MKDNGRKTYLEFRIKDFEKTIYYERKRMKVLKEQYRDKMDELESNISELNIQLSYWWDELNELKEVN